MQKLLKAGPACLLLAYTLKLVIRGAAMPDALIVAVLCALVGADLLIEHIKYKTAIQEEIAGLKTQLTAQQQALVAQDEKVKEAISYVSNMKLKTSMRIG